MDISGTIGATKTVHLSKFVEFNEGTDQNIPTQAGQKLFLGKLNKSLVGLPTSVKSDHIRMGHKIRADFPKSNTIFMKLARGMDT